MGHTELKTSHWIITRTPGPRAVYRVPTVMYSSSAASSNLSLYIDRPRHRFTFLVARTMLARLFVLISLVAQAQAFAPQV